MLWLADGDPMHPKSEQRSIEAFFERIPTWVATAVLCALGMVFIALGPALEHCGSLFHAVPAIGEALFVAGILTLAVDPWLKRKLYKEAARGAFEHLIGFDHEPELKARIRSIAFETQLYIRNYDLQCEIEPKEGGGVVITAVKTLDVENQGLTNAKFSPGWTFAEADRPSDCEVTQFCGSAKITRPPFLLDKQGYFSAHADPVEIEPRTGGKRYRFVAKCKFEAPNDWYHPMYFGYPTIGVTARLRVPQDWKGWVGWQTDPSSEVVFQNTGLYMPSEKIEIQWRKPPEPAKA